MSGFYLIPESDLFGCEIWICCGCDGGGDDDDDGDYNDDDKINSEKKC